MNFSDMLIRGTKCCTSSSAFVIGRSYMTWYADARFLSQSSEISISKVSSQSVYCAGYVAGFRPSAFIVLVHHIIVVYTAAHSLRMARL